MSIEAKIEALTAAVQQLTAAVQAAGSVSVPQHAPVAQPPVAAPVPMAAPAPVAMPAPPTFQMPVAAPVTPPVPAGAPFSDAQGLMSYAMESYKAMGAEKGARIQGVLQSLGVANLNDVQPAQYGQFYSGVEALKAS